MGLSRSPNADERDVSLKVLSQPLPPVQKSSTKAGPPGVTPGPALTAFCHALVNSAPFLFVD